jgi:hypothetical protein
MFNFSLNNALPAFFELSPEIPWRQAGIFFEGTTEIKLVFPTNPVTNFRNG